VKTGIYVPIPHVTAHSPRLAAATAAAQRPLAPLEVDPAFTLARDSVLEAERLGFDLALFAERHLGPDLEAWVLGAAVASHTSRIQIMPASNPDFWHPNMLAKMAATLDRIAPGRSAINFVTGWSRDEQSYFSSVRHDSDEARYSRAEAFIDTMRATWSADRDTPVEVVEGAEFYPAALPLATAGEFPPIYAVSRSERGLDMVAKSADHWFVDWGSGFDRTFDEVLESARVSIDQMRERAAHYGREVGLCVSAFVLPAATEEEGWQRVDELQARTRSTTPHLVGPQLGAMGARLVGPPSLIRDRIDRFRELGVEFLLCKYVPDVDALDELADVVSPIAVVS
jgi:FMNH2-dependent dimethyl sulfone monooxygenase